VKKKQVVQDVYVDQAVSCLQDEIT